MRSFIKFFVVMFSIWGFLSRLDQSKRRPASGRSHIPERRLSRYSGPKSRYSGPKSRYSQPVKKPPFEAMTLASIFLSRHKQDKKKPPLTATGALLNALARHRESKNKR